MAFEEFMNKLPETKKKVNFHPAFNLFWVQFCAIMREYGESGKYTISDAKKFWDNNEEIRKIYNTMSENLKGEGKKENEEKEEKKDECFAKFQDYFHCFHYKSNFLLFLYF